MICEGKTVAEIVSAGNSWSARIRYLRPKHVVELGTGQGAGGAKIMQALEPDARFTTINYADGEVFGEQLTPWCSDPRLVCISADTIDPETLKLVPDGVDLLFIDTTHEAWHAATELRMWQYKLQDGAVVVVDDLDQHDMMLFWDSLPYDKSIDGSQGVFRYDSLRRYGNAFGLPERTTYGGNRICR